MKTSSPSARWSAATRRSCTRADRSRPRLRRARCSTIRRRISALSGRAQTSRTRRSRPNSSQSGAARLRSGRRHEEDVAKVYPEAEPVADALTHEATERLPDVAHRAAAKLEERGDVVERVVIGGGLDAGHTEAEPLEHPRQRLSGEVVHMGRRMDLPPLRAA